MPVRQGEQFWRTDYGTEWWRAGISRVRPSRSVRKGLRVASSLSRLVFSQLHQSSTNTGGLASNEACQSGARKRCDRRKNGQETRGASRQNFQSRKWTSQLPDPSVESWKTVKGLPVTSWVFTEAALRPGECPTKWLFGSPRVKYLIWDWCRLVYV